MQAHVEEISRHVAKGGTPSCCSTASAGTQQTRSPSRKNMTVVLLPSRAPELNPVENIWQYLRANWLSNSLFETYGDIIDAASATWNKLIALALRHHLNRNARLGPYRSFIGAVDITTIASWRLLLRAPGRESWQQTGRGF